MKFCKDCKWFRPNDGDSDIYKYAKCASPQAEFNPVSGEPLLMYCFSQRMDATKSCKPEALWFEPKEPTP